MVAGVLSIPKYIDYRLTCKSLLKKIKIYLSDFKLFT